MKTSTSALFCLVGPLVRAMVGMIVLGSLLMMQLQVCAPPSKSFDAGSDIVICSDDGVVSINTPADSNKSGHSCDRCLDCTLCSHVLLGLPDRSESIDLQFAHALDAAVTLETLLLALPDHLLPFSGAPPPSLQDQFMLQMSSVPMRFASTPMRVMPEIISWR